MTKVWEVEIRSIHYSGEHATLHFIASNVKEAANKAISYSKKHKVISGTPFVTRVSFFTEINL